MVTIWPTFRNFATDSWKFYIVEQIKEDQIPSSLIWKSKLRFKARATFLNFDKTCSDSSFSIPLRTRREPASGFSPLQRISAFFIKMGASILASIMSAV